jgi:hypothetical protein
MLTKQFGGANVLKVALVDTGTYTRADSTDHYFSVIPSGAISATSDALTNVAITTSGGSAVLDADDAVCKQAGASVPSAELVVIYADTGDPTTSPICAIIDADPSGTALTMTFNGSDWVIQWPSAGILAV